MTSAHDPGDGPPEHEPIPVAEVVTHLQAAALEMLAAARAFLDAAEAVVKDPAGAAAVAVTLAEKARRRPPPVDDDGGGDEDGGDDDGRVQHIPVS